MKRQILESKIETVLTRESRCYNVTWYLIWEEASCIGLGFQIRGEKTTAFEIVSDNPGALVYSGNNVYQVSDLARDGIRLGEGDRDRFVAEWFRLVTLFHVTRERAEKSAPANDPGRESP